MSRHFAVILYFLGISSFLIAIATDGPDDPPAEPGEEKALPPPPTTMNPDELQRDRADFFIEVATTEELRRALANAPHRSTIQIEGEGQFLIDDGPIEVDTMVTIRGSEGTGSVTTEGSQGAFFVHRDGILRLQNLTFKNAAGEEAPAIQNEGLLFLDQMRFVDHMRPTGPTVLSSSHRLVARAVILEQNHSEDGPGAIEITDGTAHFEGLDAVENRGTKGGVMVNSGELHLRNSHLAANRAAEGGAILNQGKLHIGSTTFWENRGVGRDSFGGALLNEGRAWSTNTTFVGNRATFGSAVAADKGRLDLAHTTFENNPNRVGSDLYVGPRAHLTVRNSVLSRRAHTAMSVDVVHGGTLESLGGNVVPQPDFVWPDDAPHLGDHLGRFGRRSTFSMASPSGDAGSAKVVPLGEGHPGLAHVPGSRCRDAYDIPLHLDQAGNSRPIEHHCDAGAHQRSTAPSAVSSRD